MIRKHLLLNQAPSDGGGSPAAPASSQAAPAATPQEKAPETKQPNKLKPQAPRPPTPDELKQEFKMEPGILDITVEQLPVSEDIEKKRADALKVEVPQPDKKVEAAPVEKKEQKVEEPKVETVSAAEPAVPETQPGMITIPKKNGKEFDYSGFSEKEVTFLKQMSNQAKEYVAGLIKENKQNAGLKDGSFLQHPNAYILAPEFVKFNQDEVFAQREFAFWQSQLAKINAGEEWTPLRGFDQNGNPVTEAARNPTTLDAEQVRMNLNQVNTFIQQNRQQMQQFASNYQQRVQTDLQNINAERSRRFAWVANPQLMQEKIQIEGVGEKTIKDAQTDFVNLFPPYLRNTPGVQIAADMWIGILIYGQQLKEAQAQKQVSEIKREELKRAEPTSNARPAPAKTAVNGVSEFSLEGMPS